MMNRRQFVINAAMTSTIMAGTGLFSYAAKMAAAGKNVRWSMGWILWREFSSRKIPLSEAIQDLSDLGLDGIEFTPRKDELSKHGFTREKFRDLLAEKKLNVTGHYFSAPFQDSTQREKVILSFKDTLEDLKFYGAKNVIIGPPLTPDRRDNLKFVRNMAPILDELGNMAVDSGMEIGIHQHVNTMIETSGEVDLIMSLTNPKYVFFSPDTGHLALAGCNVINTLRKYRERLNYFHFKDVKGTFSRPDFAPNLRELGQGEIDYHGIMAFLKEIKYKGWLNVEQDHTFLTPRESATKSMEFINTKLKPIIR